MYPGSNRISKQSFVCCGGASGLWQPHGLAGPGSCLPLTWRVGPGPWRAGSSLSWRAVERLPGLMKMEGLGVEIGLLVRWCQGLL